MNALRTEGLYKLVEIKELAISACPEGVQLEYGELLK